MSTRKFFPHTAPKDNLSEAEIDLRMQQLHQARNQCRLRLDAVLEQLKNQKQNKNGNKEEENAN